MGLGKELLKLGALALLSVAVDKIAEADRKKKANTKQKDVDPPKKETDSPQPAQCKRCGVKTTEWIYIDGKPVCPSCAVVVIAEKKRGYQHGPGFGRISNRCCARCQVDLIQLGPDNIQSIDGHEYCDICAAKITEAIESTKAVFEQVFKYLSNLFHDLTYEINKDGEYWIKSPENGNGNHIDVWIGEELTLGFTDWHDHYSFDPSGMVEFYVDLNALVRNERCTACSYYKKKDGLEYWGGSRLLSEEQITDDQLYSDFGDNQKIVCSFWDASKDKTIIIKTGMRELTNDPFYTLIENYSDCCLDYCLLKSKSCTQSKSTHREAIQFAMEKICNEYDIFYYNIREASSEQIDAEAFLSVPSVPWRHKNKDVESIIPEVAGDKLQYWFAFLEPPTGSRLTVDDFHRVNQELFPNGPQSLTVMEWSTDWSDYFDEGHEWWGTGCWSIYDKSLDRYVVILASATD